MASLILVISYAGDPSAGALHRRGRRGRPPRAWRTKMGAAVRALGSPGP